jgi:UDP-glucuronate 4-epimerase
LGFARPRGVPRRMGGFEPILVTGVAGFIGFHVARRLLDDGRVVVGIDNLNSYYDVRLKERRLRELDGAPGFRFERMDIADRFAIAKLFDQLRFPAVIHLAAQAGVRHSLLDPYAYGEANLSGFLNVLEGCRQNGCQHLIYASSSSVYGANSRMPFRTVDNVDHPVSLYGATKKANELMAHAYAQLFALPATGLRFFTVYGPWGRPDMAMWLFTKAVLQGRPIRLFNYGRMRRDFTYIDDVTAAVTALVRRPAQPDPDWTPMAPNAASSRAPWRVYNVGAHRPIAVEYLVSLIEAATGRSAVRELLPMQPGDVEETYADVSELAAAVGFAPDTPIEKGVERFVLWYRNYCSSSAGRAHGSAT